MIRAVLNLLQPPAAECGVADHFVGLPDDLPCRDAATVQASFHCPGCGPRLRVVCTHHAAVIRRDPNVGCEICAAVGEDSRIEHIDTAPAGAP